MKKTIVLVGSARSNSNTLIALDKNLPLKVDQIVELHKLDLQHYDYSIAKVQDDFLKVVEQMIAADIIVFATPVYWYSMSGIMKVFFDRFTDLITTSKHLGRALADKETYLFATGSEDDLPEGFEVPFKLTSQYFSMKYQKSFYVSIKD